MIGFAHSTGVQIADPANCLIPWHMSVPVEDEVHAGRHAIRRLVDEVKRMSASPEDKTVREF